MTKKWMIPFVLGALLLMPQTVHAFSFGGSDWLFNMTGTFHVTGLLNEDYPADVVDSPITITQADETHITIPITLPDPINETIYLPGTVSGTIIDAVTHIDELGPFYVEDVGGDVLLRNTNARLKGEATGINPLDTTGGYGSRAYYITGSPSPDSYLTTEGYMDPFGTGWIHLIDGDLEITSWNAQRGEGVPEPGTIAMLLGMMVSLTGYCLWRRRN